MEERLETAAQTASSSSRELQQSTMGSDGRRPATPRRSTSVSCHQRSKPDPVDHQPRYIHLQDEGWGFHAYHLELKPIDCDVVVKARAENRKKLSVAARGRVIDLTIATTLSVVPVLSMKLFEIILERINHVLIKVTISNIVKDGDSRHITSILMKLSISATILCSSRSISASTIGRSTSGDSPEEAATLRSSNDSPSPVDTVPVCRKSMDDICEFSRKSCSLTRFVLGSHPSAAKTVLGETPVTFATTESNTNKRD
ncbi:hypothetical protein BHE74_00040369 [Ensete ventricosum]|nr:hypothetical protein BHE74_00040369 [Ensete ventricosum]RZS15794.1 hypothetical protein BHM03_00047673 [Ensete ventricosum]